MQETRERADGTVGDPLEGRVLSDRYRLGPRIARGGMAAVHVATDLRLDRTVAVKVMHAGLGGGDDDSGFAVRFVREARAAARLSHPNVVSVFDQGEDDGTLYLVMELVTGRTLRDVVAAEAPMRPERALALLDPVLSALAAAHRGGLVHRDVKPENVLIADDGRVKVADFGLARAVSTETAHTATGGVLIGTVSYLAPELVVDGRYDARADVYAAGVVLYELLTGSKPHEGESPIQVAYRHVHHDVPAPSRLVPSLPPYVDALVARSTARDRGLRPADATVLLHQVHRVGHALAAGEWDDPELVADLALPVVHPDAETPAEERWDDDEVAALLTDEPPAPPPPSHTRALFREDAWGGPWDAEWEEVPDPRARTTSRRRGPRLLVLALVLALALAGGAYWFGWARYTATPAVVGLTQASAQADLEDAGLGVDYADAAYSETVPEGEVISTDPAPGERVLDGGDVEVVVSLGKERYDVPRLRGLTEDQAQDRLQDLTLVPDSGTERYSEKVPEGQVIRTDPALGTTLRPGASVSLVVSKGRRPIEVGDWVGEDAEEATAALEDSGLVVTTEEEFDDEVAEGDVVSQDPPDGETLFKGDEVQLVVSKGPEQVEIPSVRVLTEDAAVKKLEDLGLEVEVEDTRFSIGLGIAARTDPEAGTLVDVGSTIVLYVL